MICFFILGFLYATNRENLFYGIVERMAEIITAFITMAGIII
jgi:hypothetical protein